MSCADVAEPADDRLAQRLPVGLPVGQQDRLGSAPEGRGLGVLEIGLVREVGRGVALADLAGRRAEARGRLDEVEHVVPQPEAHGHADRLAPGPSNVEPARVVADLLGEATLAAVVELAVRRVVPEGLGGDGVGLHQDVHETGGGGHRDQALLAQRHDVREVGEVEPVVQERGVVDLEGEAGSDQLGGVGAQGRLHLDVPSRRTPRPDPAHRDSGVRATAQPGDAGTLRTRPGSRPGHPEGDVPP